MIRFLAGALAVVALVGYGVIDTADVRYAGAKVRDGVNYVLSKGAEVTRGEETVGQKIDKVLAQ